MSSRERRRPARATAFVAAAAAAVVVALVPVGVVVELDRGTLPADGRAVARVRAWPVSALGRPALGAAPALHVDRAAARALLVETFFDHEGALVLRAGTRAGALPVRDDAGRVRATLVLTPDPRDDDGDGLPDALELLSEEDRASFVSWFTAIAEAQARAIDDDWATIHHDCAGLVRFAAKEALRTHDDAWRRRRRAGPLTSASDVGQARYPALPFVGDRLFRSVGGRFDARENVEVAFTAAASARTLWQHNTRFVARDLAAARAGDLLFFSVPDDTGSRMHTMIVLGRAAGAPHDEPGARVVYHTGLEGEGGEVRLVSLDALKAHPDLGWRPTVDNPRFLGVHRLNLLTHDAEPRPLVMRGGAP